MMVYKYNILINYNNLLERKEYPGILWTLEKQKNKLCYEGNIG